MSLSHLALDFARRAVAERPSDRTPPAAPLRVGVWGFMIQGPQGYLAHGLEFRGFMTQGSQGYLGPKEQPPS